MSASGLRYLSLLVYVSAYDYVWSVNDCSVFVMEREKRGRTQVLMTLPLCQLLISNINPRTRFAKAAAIRLSSANVLARQGRTLLAARHGR